MRKKFVGEKKYQRIKESGDYTEKQEKGLTMLTEHSYEPFIGLTIIKSPKMSEDRSQKSDLLGYVFKDVTPEVIKRERERMKKGGKLKTLETPFGTLSVMNHPGFAENDILGDFQHKLKEASYELNKQVEEWIEREVSKSDVQWPSEAERRFRLDNDPASGIYKLYLDDKLVSTFNYQRFL